MIRRRLLIALGAIAAVVLAACGGGGDSSSPSGPVEITVWHGFQDTQGEVFKSLIEQYNSEHPDVKVSELYSSSVSCSWSSTHPAAMARARTSESASSPRPAAFARDGSSRPDCTAISRSSRKILDT